MNDLLNIIDETDNSCFQSYKRIAEKLMNDYKLKVGDCFYRIIECEFYFNSIKHNDPYVHGHKRQKESFGEWYFHGSGLDITLARNGTYGGILLRGIAKVNRESHIPTRSETINGPLNVCTEIFKQFGNAFTHEPTDFGLVDISIEKMGANMKTARIFAVPRIGLNDKADNERKFCKRPYRFLAFLHLPHGKSDQVKKYLVEEADELLSIEEYKQYYRGEKW
jgi:hypothetical protein